jgi:hypothetical protein
VSCSVFHPRLVMGLTLTPVRWSSDIEDIVLANQSATLYTTYNLITILLQRAFLSSSVTLLLSPRDAQPAPPGLAHAVTAHAVAVNAAKAMAQILIIIHKRTISNVPLLLVGAEIAAAVLCVDHWIIKARGGDVSHPVADSGQQPLRRLNLISKM